MNHENSNVPDGYMRNALGHLVLLEDVREQDLLRDQVANSLVNEALEINARLKKFKTRALTDIEDLIRIAAERYQVTLGGEKGNVEIMTYDGRYKVVRSIAERIAFTEELEAAKALIYACADRWCKGANPHARMLAQRAFRTNRQGEISISAVLDLLRMEVDDPEWKRATDAIKDSIQATGSATYVRIYQRVGKSSTYVAVPLNVTGV